MFIVINSLGQLFQNPVHAGHSWVHASHPSAIANADRFATGDEAQHIVDAYAGKGRIVDEAELFVS